MTGAAQGIGAATATLCASLGAELILVDRERIEDARGSARVFRADVASRAEIERIAAAVGPVDALVLNAGICPFGEDWQAPEWDQSFDRVMAVNVHGPIHVARAFLPGMIERRQGRIVLVGSLAGRMGGLIAGPHYVASKGAVHALVKWLARQAAPHGVLVNGIAPASVETAMMQGQPVDLARFPSVAWPGPRRSPPRSRSCAPPPRATSAAPCSTSTAAST